MISQAINLSMVCDFIVYIPSAFAIVSWGLSFTKNIWGYDRDKLLHPEVSVGWNSSPSAQHYFGQTKLLIVWSYGADK